MEYNKNLIGALSDMLSQHEQGVVFVTEKVSYNMRNVTRRARKNYLGVYDEPYDQVTGEEKYFPPLTEAFTDGVVKSIDIDLKDVDMYSLNGANLGATKVLKLLVRQKLKEAGFSETLNQLIRYLCIDGSGALKFIDGKKDGKRVMVIRAVDTLNLIADQSADCLNDAFGVLERSLMTQDELRQKEAVWYNIDKVLAQQPQGSFQRLPFFAGTDVASPAPYYPIYDYWGQVEKCWVTNKETDKGIWTEGHAVVANLHEAGAACVLLAEINKSGKRPYEDVSLKKVLGRRQGRGVPEMLFGTQKYMNMLVDIRKKNAQILQNGLFKAKKNIGLTADSIISKITSGGIIPVNDMDDFQQMPITDARASSYGDEDRLLAWGERSTGQFDIRRGEAMAASAPATTQLIQDRNSKDLYQLVQENLGLMLERFITKHVVPWVIDNVQDKEIVMITGSLKDLEEFDDAVAEYRVTQDVADHIEKHRQFPTPEEVVAAKDAQLKTLRKLGNRRYIEVKKKMFEGAETGVNVVVTNESVDRATILAKLQELLTLSVSAPGALDVDSQGVIDTIFDMMNVPTDRIFKSHQSFKSPIDRMKEEIEAGKQAQQVVQQTLNQAQAKNSVTGKVAPQMNSSMMETEQMMPTQLPGIRQSVTNQTSLAQ